MPHPLDAWTWIQDPDLLPSVGGSYAIWISLAQAATLPPRFQPKSGSVKTLAAGDYLYLGSAYGPGGIRARCRRHLQQEKGKRWHVDWLTTQAAKLTVCAFPGGKECVLTAAALGAGAGVPVLGLGSSDCINCPSHLVTLPLGAPHWPG
jgi:Uri superfamily endonuclease